MVSGRKPADLRDQMLSWQKSKGMATEIAQFKRAGKSIVYLDP
jgi:hypothetical protein